MVSQLMLKYTTQGVKAKVVDGVETKAAKLAFNKTVLYNCVVRATRFSIKGATEKEIGLSVQNVLRHVKDRL